MGADAMDGLAAALEGRLLGEVLVLGEPPAALARTGVRPVAAPTEAASLEALAGDYDAALVARWGPEVELVDVLSAAAKRVRAGGSVAVVARTTRRGWRGARSALFGAIRRRSRWPLEELCEAMLFAGLRDVVARELPGIEGLAVVIARVR